MDVVRKSTAQLELDLAKDVMAAQGLIQGFTLAGPCSHL